MSCAAFLVAGDLQDMCWRRMDGDDVGEAISYNTADGRRVWETHGDKNGHIIDENRILADPGLVISCYPKLVAERYPGLDVVLPEHDGPVFVRYVEAQDGYVFVIVRGLG